MSQPSAVASASFARSSPRCQLWTSLPRFPSGFSRLWSGPATKPSSEIDMWQVVRGIASSSAIDFLLLAFCNLLVRYARFRQLLQELRFEVASHTSDSLHILPQGRKGYEAAYTIHWRTTPREGRPVYFVDHLLSPLVRSNEVKRDVEVGLHGD